MTTEEDDIQRMAGESPASAIPVIITSMIPGIAGQVLAELRANLGAIWEDRISPEGREMARQAANDAAALLLAALASPRTPDADMALLRERAHLNAQLRNVLAAEASRVTGAFWSAVQAVLRGAIQVALGSI